MRIAIDWAKRGRELAILTGIGVFLAFVNPFGTGDSAPFWRSVVFWVGLSIIGSLLGEAILSNLFKRLDEWPLALRFIFVAVLMGVVMTPIVALFGMLLGGMTPLRYWYWVFYGTLIMSAFFTGVGLLMERAFREEDTAPTAETPDERRARFLQRLPVKFRSARLLAVESEDHYLRVHTDRGSDLILMRLADAVRELDGAGGVQTHRSWWVAGDAVTDAKRENGRLVLLAETGIQVPVSRTYAAKVKEAGLG